jgi:hypothetical protein
VNHDDRAGFGTSEYPVAAGKDLFNLNIVNHRQRDNRRIVRHGAGRLRENCAESD